MAIEVRGNKRIATERILAAVTETKTGESLSEEKVRADVRAVNDLGVFADVSVRTESEPDGVRVVFLVTENPVISEIVVEGNSVVSADDIRKMMGLTVGEVLDLNKMRAGVRAVQKLYEDKGYVLARVADVGILPTDPADQGRLRLRVAEGTVEGVRFEGLLRTREITARRHIQDTRVGTVFNVTLLNHDLQRLFDTGLFESVRARPEPGTTPDSAVIVIEVKEARTGQIAGGLGYSSRDGLLGFVEFRDRNWAGLGQTFAVRAERGVQIGSTRFNYEASFTEPFFDPTGTSLSLSLYSRSTIEREFSGTGVSSRFELARTGSFASLSRPLDSITTGTLQLRSERTDITALPIDPNDSSSPVVNPSNLSPGRVVSLLAAAIRDSRNDRLLPTAGEKTALSAEFALRPLGSDFGFTKYIVEYQRLFPMGGPSTIVGRVVLGASSGTLPLQEQFILGGPSTVRSLAAGFVRADSIIVTNVEYRFPLERLLPRLGDTQMILFADAGRAPIQSGDTKMGYGVGFAIKTPLGPIRIDFAFGREGTQTWLSLGAPF